MNQTKINRMCRKIKNDLDKARYDHTLGVMYTAAALAMAHMADMENALIAGLLHDCAKCIPPDRKIKLCSKYHLNVSEIERENPSLLHAKLGALISVKKYKVKDIEIVNAIASHTTGRPEMTLLEKIVFIADYIEPGRIEAPNLDEIRHIAFRDINLCMYYVLRDTLQYLHEKNIPLDPMTQKTYDYYKKKVNITEE